MAKEEKNKVGRPKLAEPELIKDSWIKVGSSLFVALVMALCGAGILTSGTPFKIESLNKIQGNVSNVDSSKVRVIKANKVTKKIIKPNGQVKYIIPAKSVNVIKVSE